MYQPQKLYQLEGYVSDENSRNGWCQGGLVNQQKEKSAVIDINFVGSVRA